MKKLLLFFMIGTGLSMGAHAQKHTGDDVPAAVKTAFARQFPGMEAKWEKTGDQYEAHFKQKRLDMSAAYQADGTLTRKEEELKIWQLPLPVRDYVEQHYGDSPKEAARVTRADGQINYEATVKGKELLFDASCTLLEETK